jgi:hypothetical protein
MILEALGGSCGGLALREQASPGCQKQQETTSDISTRNNRVLHLSR